MGVWGSGARLAVCVFRGMKGEIWGGVDRAGRSNHSRAFAPPQQINVRSGWLLTLYFALSSEPVPALFFPFLHLLPGQAGGPQEAGVVSQLSRADMHGFRRKQGEAAVQFFG
jgi:hypothetical protein